MELREGDSLEGSAHIPKYNYHILPLTVYTLYNIILFFDGRIEIFSFLTLQFLPIIIPLPLTNILKRDRKRCLVLVVSYKSTNKRAASILTTTSDCCSVIG